MTNAEYEKAYKAGHKDGVLQERKAFRTSKENIYKDALRDILNCVVVRSDTTARDVHNVFLRKIPNFLFEFGETKESSNDLGRE